MSVYFLTEWRKLRFLIKVLCSKDCRLFFAESDRRGLLWQDVTSNTQVVQTASQACPTHLHLLVKPTVMTSALISAIVLDIVRIWEKLRAGTRYIQVGSNENSMRHSQENSSPCLKCLLTTPRSQGSPLPRSRLKSNVLNRGTP